jgi:molecular chaperone HtpG
MTKETFTFQAEVGKILDIVAHSLYSEKEVFLRELISNASDACDKLRYASISDSTLLNTNSEFKIEIEVDKKK